MYLPHLARIAVYASCKHLYSKNNEELAALFNAISGFYFGGGFKMFFKKHLTR